MPPLKLIDINFNKTLHAYSETPKEIGGWNLEKSRLLLFIIDCIGTVMYNVTTVICFNNGYDKELLIANVWHSRKVEGSVLWEEEEEEEEDEEEEEIYFSFSD